METADQDFEKKKKPEGAFRLSEIVVESVDLVDRAANKKRFILFKREGQMEKGAGIQVAENREGEVISVIPDVESGTSDVEKADEKKDEKENEKKDEKQKTDEEKAKKPCQICGKEPCECEKNKAKAETKADAKADAKTEEKCPVCGKYPCVCKKDAGKVEETEKAISVCPKCGYKGPGKVGDKCPKCSTPLEAMKAKAEEDKACKKPEDDKAKKEEDKKEVKAEAQTKEKANKDPEAKKDPEEKKAAPDAEAKVGEEDKKKSETKEKTASAVQTLMGGTREAVERLMSVATVLRGATISQEQVSPPIPAKISGEIQAVKTLLSTLVQKYPSPAAKSDADQSEEALKTLLKQTPSLTMEVRDAVLETVRGSIEKLLMAMRALQEASGGDPKTDALPPEFGKAVTAVAAELESILGKYPSTAAKSVDVIAALQKHFDGIKELISDLVAGKVAPVSDSTAALEKRLTELTAENQMLKDKKLIPAGNASDAESTGVNKAAPAFRWPADIAESIKKRKK